MGSKEWFQPIGFCDPDEGWLINLMVFLYTTPTHTYHISLFPPSLSLFFLRRFLIILFLLLMMDRDHTWVSFFSLCSLV